MTAQPQYKRILLKLSGEGLMGNLDYGLDEVVVERLAQEVKGVHETGVEICIVIGGGNIFRGITGATRGMDRANADHMGMLATVINSLAVQDALERAGVPSRVLSAIPMSTVCEPYIRRRAVRHMEKGRVVIFAAGSGNPYFTTDTAAALRAAEMHCDALMKATQVDGVYSDDPKTNPDAVRYDRLTFTDVLVKGLNVMDASAIALARENNIPILVFPLSEERSIGRVLEGEHGLYTIITEEE